MDAYLLALFARSEQADAQVLAEETGAASGSIEPDVAAMALVGVVRVLFERVLAAATSDQDAKAAVAAFCNEVDRALSLLDRGLGAYAIADPQPGEASPRQPAGTAPRGPGRTHQRHRS